MEDKTALFTQEDIHANKGLSILSYLGILFLVPMLVKKDSPFIKFNVNQGIVLFIIEVIVYILSAVLSFVPFLFILFDLIGLGIFALAIIGIINCAQGTAKVLPVIGAIQLIK